uniref:Uncharacterized protein n=1 Tax=Octopus bimaculoides TaxID=37653 RepID=A0A0L8FH03_OCTBM
MVTLTKALFFPIFSLFFNAKEHYKFVKKEISIVWLSAATSIYFQYIVILWLIIFL